MSNGEIRLIEGGRKMPTAVEAEAAILGACLIRPQAKIPGWLQLLPIHFFDPKHRVVWAAMQRLDQKRTAIDEVTLETEICSQPDGRQTLDAIGGLAFLGELAIKVPTAENVEHYAEAVLETYVTREVLTIASEYMGYGYRGVDRGDSLRDELMGALARIRAYRDDGWSTMADAFEEARQQALHAGTNADLVDLGIPKLQAPVGVVTVLGARPSIGKTATVLQAARGAAHASPDEHVILVLYEDRKVTLGRRTLADVADVDISRVRRREFDLHERPRIENVAPPAELLNVHVLHAHGQPIEWVIRKVRGLAHQHKVRLLILDYIQKVPPSRETRGSTRDQQLEDIMNKLDALVVETNCAGICVSQLNRDPEKEERDPRESDLRNSGALEQVAKMIWLLARKKDSRELRVLVVKNSEGPVGMVRLDFDASRGRITEPAQQPLVPMHGGDDDRWR